MLRSVRSIAARGVEVLRGEGLAGLASRALVQLGVHRRLVVVGGRDARRPPPGPLPVECARLGAGEIDEYLALRADQDAAEIRGRLAEGQWCFGVRHEGRLVAAGWAARERVWIDYVGCELRLAADTVYAHDNYVLPALRGQGLITAMEDFRRAAIEAEGYERTVALILPQNRSASRHSAKRSDIEIGELRCWRVGPWRHHVLRVRPSRRGPMLALGARRR